MRKIALVVGMSLMGCTAWLDKLHGSSTPALPAMSKDARAEFIPDSFQFVHDWTADNRDVLWFSYNSEHVWDNHPEKLRVLLEGPGVHEDMETDSGATHEEWIVWPQKFPAGHYKVTLTDFGTPLASHEFEVGSVPRFGGGGDPVIATHTPAPMIMQGMSWHTMFGINVVRPAVIVNAVWMKGDAPLDQGTSEVARGDQLWSLTALGVWRKAAGTAPTGDLHGATLIVFLDGGARYVGAWSYVDGNGAAVVLPSVRPTIAQLRAAQKIAEVAAEASQREWGLDDIGDELVACAAMTSKDAMNAVGTLHNAGADMGYEVHRLLDAKERLEDPDLTAEQRAQLTQRMNTAGDFAEGSSIAIQRAQKTLAVAVRKQKKGCLVALGAPPAPGPTPLGDGPVASRRKK